ncbi:MAG: hypothetical protein ACYTGQ_14235 [Planctomycetota bacterium]|jgi:hypothetical protein
MGHFINGEGVQRRKSVRHAVKCVATIEPLSGGGNRSQGNEVEVHDVAQCGVMILLDRVLETGSTWRLLLGREGETVGSAPFVVRYGRLCEDGRYACGCQFMVEPALMTLMGVDEDEVRIDMPPFFVPVLGAE